MGRRVKQSNEVRFSGPAQEEAVMDGSLAYSNTVTPIKASRAAKRSKRQKSTESRRRHRDTTQNTNNEQASLVNSSYFGGPTTAASSHMFGSSGNQRHVMTFGDFNHSSA